MKLINFKTNLPYLVYEKFNKFKFCHLIVLNECVFDTKSENICLEDFTHDNVSTIHNTTLKRHKVVRMLVMNGSYKMAKLKFYVKYDTLTWYLNIAGLTKNDTWSLSANNITVHFAAFSNMIELLARFHYLWKEETLNSLYLWKFFTCFIQFENKFVLEFKIKRLHDFLILSCILYPGWWSSLVVLHGFPTYLTASLVS